MEIPAIERCPMCGNECTLNTHVIAKIFCGSNNESCGLVMYEGSDGTEAGNVESLVHLVKRWNRRTDLSWKSCEPNIQITNLRKLHERNMHTQE